LVFDSLDDDGFLHRVSASERRNKQQDSSDTIQLPIWDYFRGTLPGVILITTRSKQVALRLVEDTDTFTIEPMDAVGATTLLNKKLGMDIERSEDEMAELVTALEFMPLAIVQAASYIKQRAPRVTVAQYIEGFRKSDRKKISLLRHDGGHLRRDMKSSNAIFITWQSSFDQIREVKPSAADLLALMSFFDRQGIPDTLILSNGQSVGSGTNSVASESDEECGSESSPVEKFEEDILVLRNYSLITVSIDGRNFEMHGLVQLAMCEWLKSQGRFERYKNIFVHMLYCSFPSEPAVADVMNWPKCQLLFPHVECAIAKKPSDEEYLQKWSSLLQSASSYARLRGYMGGSLRMANLAYKARRGMLGSDHELTLDSAEVLCLARMLNCQWKEAELIALRLVETRAKFLGLHHSATLTSQQNLSSIYLHQARWRECETLQMLVLDTRIQTLGPQHPDTIMSMGSLAFTHCALARHKEAETLGLKVVASYRTLLGLEHPATLASMHNLALAYWYQGQLKAAEDLWQQVRKLNMQVLGSLHPNTLTGKLNLAMLYQRLGRFEEAADLGYQAMDGRRHVHGLEHPDTLISIFNLACTYQSQGRLKEFEELSLQLIAAHKGLKNQTYLSMTCIGNLATIYRQRGRLTEAEELGSFVMEARTRNLGPDHPLTQSSIAGLASTYRCHGRVKDAQVLESKLQDIDPKNDVKRFLGESNQEIGNDLVQEEIEFNVSGTEKSTDGKISQQGEDNLAAHGHASYCRHFGGGEIAFQYIGAWTGK
jgi:tetratricopeptide (TPR) repeat protein